MPPPESLNEMLEKDAAYTEEVMYNGLFSMNDEEVIKWLQKLVPNYNRSNSANSANSK